MGSLHRKDGVEGPLPRARVQRRALDGRRPRVPGTNGRRIRRVRHDDGQESLVDETRQRQRLAPDDVLPERHAVRVDRERHRRRVPAVLREGRAVSRGREARLDGLHVQVAAERGDDDEVNASREATNEARSDAGLVFRVAV